MPTAALNLLIGSSAGPAIDTGKGNGPLGVSGAVKGIVRPGTHTNIYPSVGIDTVNGGPPGYVFYYDYSDGGLCSVPLYGPPAVLNSLPGNPYSSGFQAWPPFPARADIGSLLSSLYRGVVAYYEIMSPQQFSAYLPGERPYLYAYHPLVEADFSSFDAIKLDIGAYEFIEKSLELKDKNRFYQYYEEEKKKKPAAS